MKKMILSLITVFFLYYGKAQHMDTTLLLCNDFSVHVSCFLDKGILSNGEVYIDFTEESILFKQTIEKIKGVEKVHASFPGKYSMLVFVGGAFDKANMVYKIIDAVKEFWCKKLNKPKPKTSRC